MTISHLLCNFLLFCLLLSPLASQAEESRFATVEPDMRIYANAPTPLAAPTEISPGRVMIFALPNGNTLEQTLGCQLADGLDWHYDIQHVLAQTRLLRTLAPEEPLTLVCAEAKGLSWPSWRGSRADGNARIAALADEWRREFGGDDARVTLTGHSGGGSFIFGVIEGNDEIPAWIDRIAILDANYSFDAAKHGAKLIRWLQGDESRRLIVLAYDDRNIEFQGKKVVGPDGGTFRATQRMVEAFKPAFAIEERKTGPFTEHYGLDGRVRFYVHPNPENKILHTALVGDMNGLVHTQTLGTAAEETWGTFGGPRAYTKFVEAKPIVDESRMPKPTAADSNAKAAPLPVREITTIPPRPADALGGTAFMAKLADLPREKREAAILAELAAGNVPAFLRQFKQVPISAGEVQGTIEVAPDYLAVGSDDDFVRLPVTPQTAQAIADKFECVLPTRKMVDAIDAGGEVRLAPQPLTEDRESVAAFLLSNEKIEAQRKGQPLGPLTIGGKKDVVVSPKMYERPDRLVIYGWRQLNGQPIQPLTNVHVDWYVDYSHGVRLVRDEITIDGKQLKIAELLRDPERCAIVSDEGVVDPSRYPTKP
ncbi:hypothetical protein [Lacipirellula parvula]|uniref:Uncharacterized protein n=1 Tax=Lacipirellula parvula TaxID=2650471 RepID=A0A5K7XM64_9BACT|nr:hypothetical protein [Lacipirellula parvula]BBO36511.1 hypothetical protein PLANPX_6123 [Lacipirellula parvula]